MEVPWRTHGWLTSHTQVGCISLNVENVEVLDQRAMWLFSGRVRQETEVSAQRGKDVGL